MQTKTLIAFATLAAVSLAWTAGRQSAPRPGSKAPELLGKSWLNTPEGKPVTLASRRGKPTLVAFWTFGCSNCLANLPSYARLAERFGPKGVELIAVHTPEFDHERDPQNVARRVRELGIDYPVLLDPKGENWRRWGQRYWPTLYALDAQGRVRFRWQGELEYRNAGGEAKVARLLEALLNEAKRRKEG